MQHGTQKDDETETPAIHFRRPQIDDGARIHRLIDECKPLDLNSVYNYLLICAHFSDTSVVAEMQGNIVGFISAYLKPADRSVVFVWQVAVSGKARGRGLAKKMLKEILSRPACQQVKYLETTVTPSNKASRALFQSLARDLNTECAESTLFTQDHFGGGQHEEEVLHRIGPIQRD